MKKAINIVIAILFFSNIAYSQTTYTVGAGGTYTTIATAYANCSAAQNYIIEIRSDYVLEALPITLAANTATSVTIRPGTGVTVNLINAAAVNTIFAFTGGDNITIDGRQGGSGPSAFTIENTGNATTKYAFLFSGGSINNTIKYCSIKGSNTMATANSVVGGIICFTSGANNNNTIDNCTFTKSGANKPAVGILSYDATNNNLLTISNCSFIDFTRYGIWASGTKNTGWTISNNKFYQTAAIVPTAVPVGVMAAIQINGGGGYTISGNNIGGRAGGISPFTVQPGIANSGFIGINFTGSTAATTNTIIQNTINDILIAITISNTTAPFCFTGINATGAANFNIGGSGNGNTIGDMTGTTYKIAITSGPGINIGSGFSAINNESQGTSIVSYNYVGSIDLSGISKEYPYVNIIRNYNAGKITIDNNTIGNTFVNNINMGGQFADLIYNEWGNTASVLTVTNNTIQNVAHSGGTSWLNIINNYGSISQCAMTCTGNIIKGINTTGGQRCICISHNATKTATISNNNINTITTTNTNGAFTGIYLSSGVAVSEINNNTIGNSSSNNISIAGNTENYAIQIMNGGTVTCNNNVLQNLTFTNVGSSSVFWGIDIGSTSTLGTAVLSASNNVIQDITTSSSHEYNESLSGIRVYSSGSGHLIYNNTLQRFRNANTATCFHELNGIAIRSSGNGGGTVSKNLIIDLNTSIVNGTIHGICYEVGMYTAGIWNFYNNAMVLNNSGQNNIVGIYVYGTDASDRGVFYHNTVKLSGTISGGVQSAAMDLIMSPITLKNNVFQNLITGGTLGNYVIHNSIGAGSSVTEINDYLEAVDPSKIGYYNGGGNKNFATWNALVGGGAGNINGNTTPVVLDGIGQPPIGAPLQNTGTNLMVTVPDDRLGAVRPTTPYVGAYEPPVPLPIELINFIGYQIENAVKLSWQTLTEINNDYFTIEKSANGQKFETIAIIDGAGNSNTILNYFSYDRTPFSGMNYYRLKQTDFNGNSSYSETIAINFTVNSNQTEVGIFPNPFNNTITIDISSLNTEKINIEILNLLGKEIYRNQNITTTNGFVNLSLEGILKPGYYCLKIEYLNKTIIKKIVKY